MRQDRTRSVLERLFTSKVSVRILEYLFFRKNETYIRGISKELKISSSAVKREVDNLIEIGLIGKEDNKLILDKSNSFFNDLKNIFLKTDYLVYPIKNALNKINAKFIFIFGSFAEGKHKLESDVDLMIIGEVIESKVFELLKPVERLIEREINPVVWTLKEFENNKNKGFVKDILKKDKIMIKGDENGL